MHCTAHEFWSEKASPPSEKKTNLGNESQRQRAGGENANRSSGWLSSEATATDPSSDPPGTGILELLRGGRGL